MSPFDRTPPSSSPAAPGRRRRLQQTAPTLQALEQRMMFDGAAVVDAAAAAAAAQQAVAADAAAHASGAAAVRDASTVRSESPTVETSRNMTTNGPDTAAATTPAPTPAPAGVAVELVAGNPAADGGRREIAFIDSSVAHWQTLAQGMRAGVEVVMIDAGSDGLRQVADYLQGTTGVDAIHLLSHGEEGDAVLGTVHLNAGTIADHQADLSRIGASLAAGGDLLLYGCDIGAGADGVAFVGQLARATGADVAASADTTGSAAYHGNWSLEVATGDITAPIALTADAQAGYDGELALPGVHTASNSTGIFLGGNYIELGIRTNNSIGKFGADTNPGGAFVGRTNTSGAAIAGIGMVGDADGFGTGAALNIDYFMPGTPEEGFYAGYKIAGTPTTGKNFGSTVTDASSGSTLGATVVGTVGGNLTVTQAISFNVNDLFFKNTVTLTNIGSSSLDSVRFMRSFDPDNTVDKGGSYSTINTIEKSIAAGDGVAAVSAKSSAGDAYSTASGGKQASIVYYSSDSRAKAGKGASGLAPSSIYDTAIYDTAAAKGSTATVDSYISIAFDVGTLAAGGSATIVYYTSLDNRDINTILGAIAAADTKSVPSIAEDATTNNGGTVSSVFGSAVAITAADNSHGSWQYSANGGTSWSDFGSVTASSARLLSSAYSVRFVPNADYNGTSALTYRVWNGNGGTAGGTADASTAGSNFSTGTANANITVTPVNDAPVLGGTPQTLAYVENAAATAIDASITVADVDAGTFSGGSLQAQITANGAAEDQLTVLNQGTSAGQIGVSGSTVSYGGTAIGTIDATLNGVNNAALKITLNASASVAATQALARAIAYRDASDAPSTAARAVTFTLNDGGNTGAGGALSATKLATVTVASVNDAPVLAGASQALAYVENQAATAIDTVVTVTDVDALNFGGGFLQAQVTANGAAEDRLSVVNGGTGAGQIGVSGSNVTYGGVVIGTLRSGATGSGTTALVVDLNTSASTAAVQALARSIGYANTSDDPSTAARTVTYTLNDGGNSGGAAATTTRTATVGVTAVDDPTLLTLTRSTASYTENDGSFYVDAGLTLSDVDTTTMNGAKVVIAGGFNGAQDRLQPASGTNADGISYAYDTAKGVLTLSGSATIAQYQAALRAVKYLNTSDAPDTSARTINITLGNAVSLSIGGVSHYYLAVNGSISWTAAKAAAEASTFQGMTGYLATLTSQAENDFITQKLSADAWIGASDDYNYINAAVGYTLYANQSAAEGHWYWVTGPEKGTAISNGNTSPVTVAGGFAFWNAGEPNNSGGSENYGEIYSTGASPGRWNDLSNNPIGSYVVEYSEAAGTSPAFSKSIVVTPVPVNDAPVITPATVTLPALTEDATSNSGALVSTLISATDPDGTAVTGIAVNGLVSSRGNWQFSIDAGASWTAVGSVSDASALLLRGGDRLRFVPDALNADSASVTYRAWDRSNENGIAFAAGNKTSVAANGGSSAYSTDTLTATVAVSAVNDAPVLTAIAPTLATIGEDTANPTGTTVAALVGGSITDVDTGASGGIAITSLQSGNGTWQYSVDGGSSWSNVGLVSANSALLLGATAAVRFVPDGANGTTASFDYKAWDRTGTGGQGSKVDASVGGGTTAFSLASDRASIAVTATNDAPVLTGAALGFARITEDDTTNAGQTVASLLGSTLSDVDAGAVGGVAVTGSTLAGTGHWEYSLDNGTNWSGVGSVSAGAALLLRGTDRLRYVPDAVNGGTATLSVRGWDQTAGSAGGVADTTLNGGTTAFSAVAATASIVVSEIDHAPVIGLSGSTPAFTENGSPVAVDGSLTVTDDSGTLAGATVRIGAGFTAGDTLAVGTPGSLSTSYNATTGILTLTGSASSAVYQAALRSVNFSTASDDPTVNAATRTIDWTAKDATGHTSAVTHTSVALTATADAPVLGVVPGTWDYTEDDGTRVIAPSLTLRDADDTRMSGATVTVSGTGYLNDGFETLSAVTTGTGITASFDANSGVLSLSGTDSAANYEKVLRSTTYTNTRDYNNPGASFGNNFVLDGTNNGRSFAWQVTDADSDGTGATSSTVGTTNVTIHDANEVPQVSNVVHNGSGRLSYTEGGAPATLENALMVADDGLVSTIESSFVRITTGLADGDQLGIDTPPTGWTRTGSATNGVLSGLNGDIAYAWSAATGTMSFTTLAGAPTDAADYTAVMQAVGFSSSSHDPTAAGPSRTLVWRVTDSGGLESAVTSAQSTVIDITAIDDTASVDPGTLPSSGTVVFTEHGSPVTLASGMTISDPDDTTLASATVRIGGAGFAAAHDYLALPGATAVAGADWTLVNIGGSGLDASFDHTTGTLSLSGTASLADYQALLRQVAFGNDDPNPTGVSTTRNIEWTLVDSFGSRLTDADPGNDSASGSAPGFPDGSQVTIVGRNDAPVFSLASSTAAWTEGGTTVLGAGSAIADVDDTTMSGATVRIATGFTAGDVLTATVGSTGITASFDATTGVMSLAGAASRSDYASVLATVAFLSTSSDPSRVAATRSFDWQVTDGNASGDGAQSSTLVRTTLAVTAVDTPSTLAGLPGNGATTYREGGSPTTLAPAFALTDGDDSRIAGATVGIVAGRSAADVLAVGTSLAGTGISAAYDASTGVLTLSGEASVADYQRALASVTFVNTGDDPTATGTTRSFAWQVTGAFGSRLTDASGANDGATGTASTVASSNLTLTAYNDAPTLALDDGTVSTTDRPVYLQGGAPVFVLHIDDTAGGVTVTDPDSGDGVASASVSITNGRLATDTLSIATPSGWTRTGNVYDNGAGTSITATFDSSTGILTMTGTGSRAAYQTLLGNVQFVNSSLAPTANGADREITWRVTDTNSAGDGARIGTAVSHLVIRDLNDPPAVTPATLTASYTEGDAAIALTGFVVADPDTDEIVTATMTLDHPAAGLLTTPSGASYNASTGVWTFVGTVPAVNAALAAVSFVPTADNDVDTTITLVVADGGEDGAVPATAHFTLHVTAVNDAPVLTPAGAVLPTLTEGDTANAGFTVASFRGAIADPDTGALAGIALTGTTDGNGRWQYSLDGTTWADVGSVDAGHALVLRDTDHLRFVPDGLNGTTGSLTYRAWDRSSGTAGNKVNATSTGNATAFSNDADTATITVTSVNDAPVLTPVATVLPAIDEDATANAGFTVASFRGAISDVDTGALTGIVLTGTGNGNGHWQYSLDGTTWVEVGSVDAGHALALRDTDKLRFVPDGLNATAATLTYRAWDQSSGSVGMRLDASANGGATAFSAADDTATIAVTGTNDAPVLTPAAPVLPALGEDDRANAGFTVASFRGTIADADAGALAGIVLTGTVDGNGRWQYSLDGTTWTDVGTVAAGHALALRDTDKLRFVPDGNNPTTASLGYRAWDRTVGAAGSKLDATTTGGTSAFSTASDTASLDVTAVNDAPVMSAASPTLPTIDEDSLANTGIGVGALIGTSVVDADDGAQRGIAITSAPSTGGTWQYSTDGGSSWSDVGAVGEGSARLLRETDRVRFRPDGANAAAPTFAYRAWDGSTGTAGGLGDASVHGGTSAFSDGENTAALTVTASNDAPVLTPVAAVLPSISEDATANAGFTVASFRGSISDVDAGALTGIVLTGTVDGNGHWQYSLDGTAWVDVGAVDAGHALALRDTDKLRFVPDGNNPTSASLGYRAWDRTVGAAGSTLDATTTGGTGALSTASDTARLDVTAVNDAPVLTPAGAALPTITEDATANAGFTVASFRGTVADADAGARPGIVLTGTVDGNGHWQYSLDGTAWTDVGTVDAGHALALRDTDRLRFVPDGMNATTGSLAYRAWDQSVGSAGSKLDAGTTGGATAFSAASDVATIAVTAVNDAPVNDSAPVTSGASRADGSVRQDGTLTATPGTWHDVDAGAPAPTFSYQWQIADDANGTNLRNLDGATASSLLLDGATVGRYVRVQVIASDGVAASRPAYGAFQHVTNADPTAGAPLASPRATEAVPYAYTVPADAFGDRDAEDTLHYTATLADGSALPGWLVFDPSTRTFSGTPTGRDIGPLDIRVTADDRGGHPVSSGFRLDVAGVPTAAAQIATADADAGRIATAPTPASVSEASARIAPFGSGGIATGDTFAPAAAAGGGRGILSGTVSALTGGLGGGNVPGLQGLPSGTLGPVNDGGSGNPLAAVLATPAPSVADPGARGGLATAADPTTGPTRADGATATRGSAAAAGNAARTDATPESGFTRSEGFRAVVPQVSSNEAILSVANVPQPQLAKPAQAIDYVLAPDTFTHTRTDAVITLSARRADGSALPGWMTFNARDGRFTGTPPADADGNVDVTVTATDNFGNVQTVLVRVVVQGDGGVAKPQGKAGLSTQLKLARKVERPGERVALSMKAGKRA